MSTHRNVPRTLRLLSIAGVVAGTLACGGPDDVRCATCDDGLCPASCDPSASEFATAENAVRPSKRDAGSGPVDAGSAPVDAGSGPADAGPAPDAGSAPESCTLGCVAEAPLVTRTWTESTGDVMNPERGFFEFVDLPAADVSKVRTRGHTLVYARVRLDAFRKASLTSKFLSDLDAAFGRMRTAGIKAVPRFVYNDGGADAPKSRVLEHISQLTPVLRSNADVIATLQAGFIGRWGEWHGSTNGLDTPAARSEILRAELTALPSSRMVQVRTPHFKNEAVGGPIEEDDAFDGSNAARVGHHNDCFLASDNDLGTYLAPVATWKAFVAQEGRFLPIGGETCAVNAPRTDCPSATAELASLHWSFMNVGYHPTVLSRWSTQGCMPEITRRLGYRFVLETSGVSESVRPGGAFNLRATIRNDGYAAPFNARPVVVVVDAPGRRYEVTLANVDPRRWEAGTTTAIDRTLRLPATIPAGTYRVSLWLPDASSTLRARPEYAVRLASDGSWVQDVGLNVLTTALVVSPSAPGTADPSASTFIEVP